MKAKKEKKLAADHSTDLAPRLDLVVATSLSEGAKVRDCRRISHTEHGATFNENMTQDQFLEYGRALRRFKDFYSYYLTDWMRFGKKKWGAEFVDSALSQLEFSFGDVEKSSALALLPARAVTLSLEHNYVVSLAIGKEQITEDQAEKWFLLAKEESLTPVELQKSIEAGHVIHLQKENQGSNRTGFLSIHGIGTMFCRWRKNVEAETPIDKMPAEQKAQILEEIKPIAELYEKLTKETQS